jgi:ribonuclease BN (tRNA processing enzyme)
MHPDHYSGLASLLIQMKLIKRTEELLLYVHESLQDTISNFIKISYLFSERLGFKLDIRPYTSDAFFHPLDNLEVLARQNSHLDDYIKDSPGGLSFSCSSYLFNFDNKLVFYTGDIGSEEDLYLFDDYYFDIMISEVTHVEQENIFKAFRSSGAKKLYLTHLSDNDFFNIEAKQQEIIIAYDGLTIPI